MEYYWDQKDIISARDGVYKLLETETNLEKIAFYVTIIDAINYHLNLENDQSFPKPIDLQDCLRDISGELLGYSRFLQFIEKFVSILNPLYNDFNEIERQIENLQKKDKNFLTFKRYGDEKTFHLTDLFYSNFDNEIYSIFKQLFQKRHHSIKYTNTYQSLNVNQPYETRGNCLFIGGVNRAFIELDNTKGLSKVSNTIHEAGHAINFFINPKSSIVSQIDFVKEAPAIFPELTFLYDQGRAIDSFQSSLITFNLLYFYYEKATHICMQEVICNLWEQNNQRLNRNLYNELKKRYNIDKNLARQIIVSSLLKEGPYIISLIVVLELLHQYKEDKEKALYEYKKHILSNSSTDSYFSLLKIDSELPLFNHLEEEAYSITKVIKNEIKKK